MHNRNVTLAASEWITCSKISRLFTIWSLQLKFHLLKICHWITCNHIHVDTDQKKIILSSSCSELTHEQNLKLCYTHIRCSQAILAPECHLTFPLVPCALVKWLTHVKCWDVDMKWCSSVSMANVLHTMKTYAVCNKRKVRALVSSALPFSGSECWRPEFQG